MHISDTESTVPVHVQGYLTAVRYNDEIILPHAIHEPVYVVPQHDNVRPHSARFTTDFQAQNNIPVLQRSSRVSNVNQIWGFCIEIRSRYLLATAK